MCVVSAVGDNYRDNFPGRWPGIMPNYPAGPGVIPIYPAPPSSTHPTVFVPKEDFDRLKKEVEDLKELLKAAQKFDEASGQKECHADEKVEFIRKLAEFVGVDLEEVFGKS